MSTPTPGPGRAGAGQDLEIALPLNAGTGYAWRLDHEALALLSGGSSFTTEAKAPGAPVRMVYRYTAVARGRTDLAFTLKRPWEPDAPTIAGRLPYQGALRRAKPDRTASIFGRLELLQRRKATLQTAIATLDPHWRKNRNFI
jgi:predicted secreted protein